MQNHRIDREYRRVTGSPEVDLVCERCGATNASRNRQHTNYEDDAENYATYCQECQDEADAYWDEMWEQAYGLG